RPRYTAVVFDAPGETFRDNLYAAYKQNRPGVPDELRPQMGYIRRIVDAFRLPVIQVSGVEADDVIGTLAAQASAAGRETVVVTGDKDMMQLVDGRTTLLDTMRDRRFGPDDVRARFGVDPALVPDVMGLMGDPIDNIPGVAGIGEKTASALVSRLGPVEQILERLDEVETIGLRGAKKVRETLAREAESARLSKALATIRCDVPITLDLEALRWDGPDPARLRPLFVELEFDSLLRELVRSGEAPEVERCALRTAAEVAAALPALCATGTLAVACALDSGRATAGRLTALAVAAPSGPVNAVATPEEPAVLAALGPALGDLAVAKLGGDLKTLRVALARRGIALAGPTFDVSLASYCLNPTRADHGVAALAEELLGAGRAPAGGEFNTPSPPQLRVVLFEKLKISTRGIRRGKTGLSTDVDVLTRLAREHPLPAKILEYRMLSKLKSTYVDALPALVDPRTGRLHTSFNQTVAATGRLSSSEPNLQNIPIRTEEGRRIRAAFVAPPGHRLISADYSQIELRVLAHLSGDPALIEAFTRGDDVHARTAADVFGG